MSNSLFVGGFPYETTQDDLAKVFAACGQVTGVKILMDRETGRSRGIGFVDMATPADAQAAIAKLNGSLLGSRKIFVNEARPQEKRPEGFAAKPGFVERRSGVRDRRRQPGGDKKWGDKPGFAGKKKWGDKPGFGDKKKWDAKPGFAGKKKWDGKPGFGDKKKWDAKPGFAGKKKDFSGKKKWSPAGPGAGHKWGKKPRKFGGGFGGR